MKCSDIIKELEKTSGRNDKIDILARHISSNTNFYDGLLVTYDYLQIFHVDKIPEKEESNNTFELGIADIHESFMTVLRALQTRNITGNRAKEAIAALMAKCDSNEWNYWYRRILKKDLGCGINVSSINKAIEKAKGLALIPTFEVQLATTSEDHLHKFLNKNVRVEVKYDGVRAITIVDKNSVTMMSRNGKPLNNFKKITEQFESLNLDDGYVFDGEIISENFAKLMTQTNRKENVNVDDCSYVIFDIVPLKDFKERECALTLVQRSDLLKKVLSIHKEKLKDISIVDHTELLLFNESVLDPLMKQALEWNFEGIMVKDPNSLYEFKRSDAWLKIKPWIDMDLKVVDIHIGTGKNSHRLGNLICRGEYKGQELEVSVGSGFSEEQREDIWQNKSKVMGQIVEVIADCISENSKTKQKSLRFPRFIRFRGFEPEEKL